MRLKDEEEKLEQWMVEHGFATGHGDTIEDLLKELERQIAEREREACAKVCEELIEHAKNLGHNGVLLAAYSCATAIRARSLK